MYSREWGGGASKSVALPPGMSPGAIIGKGGSNIKLLQSRSGARVSVNSSGRVEVSGSATAVDAAVRMLHQQIDAFTATGGAYPHPLQVHYLLATGFGDTPSAVLGFEAASGEVARAADRPEQLYVLQPRGRAAEPAGSSSSAGVSELLAGLSLGPSACAAAPWLMLGGQRGQFLQAAAKAAEQAVAHRPQFDEIKLRCNFGKNLFYKGPSGSSSWTVQQMQRKSIPTDLKSVFSNAVTAEQQAQLVAWLHLQGFEEVEQKHTASVHLVQRSTNAGYALSFITSSGDVFLRKLKSANNKLAFGTLLNGPTSPDWRFKLLAQYRFKADPATQQRLTGIAESARLSSTGSSSSIVMAGLAAADMMVDKERHKVKTIYEGTTGRSSTLVKVTVSRVYDATHRRHGFEVTGTSPQLQQLLQDLLRRGSLGSSEQQLVLQHLDNLLAFAQAATRCMAA